MVYQDKAFAYITYQHQLLVFRHVGIPKAGLQVPAGTIEPGESPRSAALREAWEETGLRGLILVSYLGKRVRAMTDWGRDEQQQRHFFHLSCPQQPARTWFHTEPDPSGGQGDGPLFAFFWVDLTVGAPFLIADHGALLPALLAGMDISY